MPVGERPIVDLQKEEFHIYGCADNIVSLVNGHFCYNRQGSSGEWHEDNI